MLGLVLETSTERGLLAVYRDSCCLFLHELPVGLQSSHLLLPKLQKKIDEKVFNLKDLSFIAVGIGPGSYTGIRVGATIAKSLAFVLQIPIIGICTLETFIPDQDCIFAAMIDAKIGGVYLQISRYEKGITTTIKKPKAYSLVEAAEILKNVSVIVTPNAEKIQSKLEMLVPSHKWLWKEYYPNAEQLIRLAQMEMAAGNQSNDGHLELLYMRKTQAEIEREVARMAAEKSYLI